MELDRKVKRRFEQGGTLDKCRRNCLDAPRHRLGSNTPCPQAHTGGSRAAGFQLGRIATVGASVPVGWIYNAARDTIDIGGREPARSKKFRDVARSGRAAIVIDDLASTDPWRPRGVEIRGRGETIALPTPLIRIHPERIVSWGLEVARSARTVAP